MPTQATASKTRTNVLGTVKSVKAQYDASPTRPHFEGLTVDEICDFIRRHDRAHWSSRAQVINALAILTHRRTGQRLVARTSWQGQIEVVRYGLPS